MICHFTGMPCQYVYCGLWSERLDACKFTLVIDKLLGNEDKPIPELTITESNILSLISQGYSNKQIAMAKSISLQTIKNHVSAILQKLGARNRTEAMIIGFRIGAVSLGGRLKN